MKASGATSRRAASGWAASSTTPTSANEASAGATAAAVTYSLSRVPQTACPVDSRTASPTAVSEIHPERSAASPAAAQPRGSSGDADARTAV